MNREKKQMGFSAGLVLLTLCVFVVLIMLVVLSGASSYKRLVERSDSVYDWRTASQYLSTKVQQSDQAGAVWVDQFDADTELDTLFLEEETDGQRYITRIYCYDGYLYELYADAAAQLAPGDGMKITPLEALSFTKDGGLITAEISCVDGREIQQVFGLRAGSENGYEK